MPLLTLCDLGAPGWGEPWFLHSAVLLRLLTEFVYGDFCVLFLFFFPKHHRCGDLLSAPHQELSKCRQRFWKGSLCQQCEDLQ